MAYEQKEGSGALFKNLDKDEERHADYKGDILINGQSYWLNAWLKKSKDGNKTYLSISAKPKDPNKTVSSALKKIRDDSKSRSAKTGFEDDDSIPF